MPLKASSLGPQCGGHPWVRTHAQMAAVRARRSVAARARRSRLRHEARKGFRYWPLWQERRMQACRCLGLESFLERCDFLRPLEATPLFRTCRYARSRFPQIMAQSWLRWGDRTKMRRICCSLHIGYNSRLLERAVLSVIKPMLHRQGAFAKLAFRGGRQYIIYDPGNGDLPGWWPRRWNRDKALSRKLREVPPLPGFLRPA